MRKNISWTQLVQPDIDDAAAFRSLASSIERGSTVVFPNVASVRRRNWRDPTQYGYGLYGTPTTKRLERKLALLEDGLWLRSASHANAMAARLTAAVSGIDGVQLTQPTAANAVFATLAPGVADRIREHFRFYDWDQSTGEVRWMCTFDTTAEDVDAFAEAIRRETRSS